MHLLVITDTNKNYSPYLAVRIMDAMNRSVDPCQDFYEFACGGWISRNPIPQSQTSWDQLSLLREQLLKDLRILLEETDEENDLRPVKLARALYRTCMNISKKNPNFNTQNIDNIQNIDKERIHCQASNRTEGETK